MRSLLALTVAEFKSFVRDRAALFWTLAFPLVFIVMFGLIFSSSGGGPLPVGWVDEDGSAQSAQLRTAFAAVGSIELTDSAREEARTDMQAGTLDAVLVVPAGYGAAVEAGLSGSAAPPATITVITDPSQEQATGQVYQVVGTVLGIVNLRGQPPLVQPAPETIQSENINFISYFVPSMLGLSVMQVGIFAAVSLVADREKLILKRLAATPIRRWQLVGANILVRLLIALIQTIIIVAVGTMAFGVEITGSMLLAFAFVTLGAVTFLSLGYVIASFARTEEAANSMTSMVQFPMMFLSGAFFPIDQMPQVLQSVARLIPLTYLADALRQVMVGGTAFAPLWVCAAVLVGWLVVCFGIASRKFRWQ